MALPSPKHLLPAQVVELFANYDPAQELEVVQIRYKNRDEIRKSEWMKVSEIQAFILECIEDAHQPGGDIEVLLPRSNEVLVGHHDGVYWLKTTNA